MNCFASVHGHRVLGLAAALWLLASIDAHAQFAFPQGQAAGATQPTATAQPVVGKLTSAQGQRLVAEVRTAMTNRDFKQAVGKYRQLAAAAPELPELVPDVARLRLDLQIAGVDSAMLSGQPAANVTALPPVKNAMPIASAVATAPPLTNTTNRTNATNNPIPNTAASRKTQALRLVALGRAALDRGDASTALQIAKQAQALKVPEKDFAAGEPRVWQFVLDAESAARRSGVALAGGQNYSTNPVQQAFATQPADEAGMIAQMLFKNDSGQGSQVKQVQAEEAYTNPLEEEVAGRGSNYGERLFYAGMDALSAGDSQTARTRFSQAWEYESQLDLGIRRQLKDKLTLLPGPKRLGQSGQDPNAAPTPIDRAELQAVAETQELFRDISIEIARIAEKRTSAPLDALDQLGRLRRRVDAASIDSSSRRSLAVMVDRALADQKQYVEANRSTIELDLRNEAVKLEMASEDEREIRIDEEISALVETFNDLIEERRFPEAEVVAKKVSELKPGSPIAVSMFHVSRLGTRRLIGEEIQSNKNDGFLREFDGIDRAATPMLAEDSIEYTDPVTWAELTKRRLENQYDDTRLSQSEREIKRKLMDMVKVSYDERPLGEVLQDLSAMAGIQIRMDRRALQQARVTSASPCTLNVPQGVKLKSALNLLLEDLDLTYVIENDVLNITSIEARRSKVFPRTYRVTDLVTPIPNFTSSYEDGLAGALRAAYQMASPQTDIHITPVSLGGPDIRAGAANQLSPNKISPTMLGQYAGLGSQGGFGSPNSNIPGARGSGGGAFADFDSLMQLIQQTVVPDTWEALGGPSTMAPYQQNLSLVISTTSDVHDQITDLLESLRALQNLQITIEVRFITLSDTFFEQIGVNFDFQFDDNTTALPQDDAGPSVAIGFGANGLPTPDLDIRFENNSFGVTPPFGAPDAGAISTIGFAILSDIEAFFFLQAAQGDNRNNVMQAPKVTLFDGQIATIADITQRPFVTSITPIVGDFAVAQQPVIVVLNEGTQLNVQGVVSNDKRFVRLTLVPFFSQIGDVDTFTFEGSSTSSSSSVTENGDTNGDGVVDDDDASNTEQAQETFNGTTVQLPTFASTSVSTTVSVPDGGTILLGGIKRLAEGRAERGVPVLSKIPYISRLFRNVAVGRDARSLMLMVTPRIIIQEEEEIAQTGFNPDQ